MPRRKVVIQGDPKRVVGYVRVSTTDQHLGPEVQRSHIKEWCERNGAFLVGMFEDVGRSGSLPADKRPGLTMALGRLEAQRAGVLLVMKWDRLARDVGVALAIEKAVKDSGGQIVSADGTGFGDGPDAELMRIIQLAFAQYERTRIRMRTRQALAMLRAKGLAIGGEQPYGQKVVEGRKVEPDLAEMAVVDQVRSLKAQGLSFRGIVRELNAKSVPARGGRWHKTTVVRMLRRYGPTPSNGNASAA